jgi:hypothetical protein
MTASSYPKPVADIVATATDICRHQKRIELVELLENAHAYFDEINYDNWNGGTTTWALRLEVPTHIFAVIHPRLAEAETELLQKLDYLNRLFPNDPLGEVTITPFTSAEISIGQRLAPSETDVRRLWRDSYFRLFISHVSLHKVQVGELKSSLLDYGVSAFVAHEDIEPSLEWQNEISLALRSMDAVVAILTPDFHSSNWTDQEVGWALGRGVPAIPVRLGTDPYGFLGKIQAIRGTLDESVSLAHSITQTLLKNKQVHGTMRRALVEAFEKANTVCDLERVTKLILGIDSFGDDEKERLRNACASNGRIANAHLIREAIYEFLGAPQEVSAEIDEIPF